MIKGKTWQRILLCMLLFGLFAETPNLYAAAFSLTPGYMADSTTGNSIVSNNDYYLKPLKYAAKPDMFKIVDVNKKKADQLAALTQNEFMPKFTPKALPAIAGTVTKPAQGVNKQGAVAVSAPKQEQVIHTMKVMATGYTAGYESTGKLPSHPQYGITYSGVKVRRDKNTISTIAADPRVFPLGTVLYIPEYGYAIVADVGSAIKGRKIDLYFATTKQVYKEWGKKEVEVQVIKRGNGKCNEKMLNALGKAIQTYKSVPASLLEEAI
ncbi:3D domain-containing protein [Paenibacillus chibensis]|uniref:3D domain-containing protein n=2 Tax=Paenibacillus chibensis TaxID=59846 RepID=A0ABU6PY39_9BACL|nr:3D domain-containing protein [Paenibacillus chibensis]